MGVDNLLQSSQRSPKHSYFSGKGDKIKVDQLFCLPECPSDVLKHHPQTSLQLQAVRTSPGWRLESSWLPFWTSGKSAHLPRGVMLLTETPSTAHTGQRVTY